MDLSDFLTLDVIVNRERSLVASLFGPKTKRQRRKAYERWLNARPAFQPDDVARQNLTEAAARLIYGTAAVDHYIAVVEHHRPWQEPFIGYWTNVPMDEVAYFADCDGRCHVPTYNAHHPKAPWGT